MSLKPQDTLLLIKYWSNNQSRTVPSIREMAETIGLSASEISKGNKRLIAANLLAERNNQYYPEKNGLLEWLCYGVRYAYAAEQSGFGRGTATAWNCKLVKTDILPPIPALVWKSTRGEQEGIYIDPIHSSVVIAASRDKLLYEAFALIDAIRTGKPRELKIARDSLNTLIRSS